ncbi:hypothetical protein IAI58_22915 (plasmid) [Roseomonas marmotae]|uniref:helix-turn-helix domain-containing protein n=1 Tax=Roseomonas marmotae TaxID=2768161 RepID=UPI001AD6738F|nr:helix-turn-helix domain-containing protein [Roseomonas marmotae]QTI82199.1 hypothetical protein IAI58_22915 [Roseomonas marmotae]
MPARLVRLRTKEHRLKVDQAALLRQAVLAFPGLPEQAVGAIVSTIDQQTAAENGWTFVMLSPAANDLVVSWMLEHSKRPQMAMRLWSKLFLHLDRDTGEILQTRDELAAAINAKADHVSEIMGELESFGAISKRRVKVAGMRGPGMVRYFMNPNVATHQTGQARDKAQKAASHLRLVK